MTDAADPQAPRDRGLQGERTALSWNRTALTIAVNALLALRTGWVSGEPWLLGLGALLLVAAGATVAYGNLRGRALAGHRGHHEPPAAPALAVTLIAATAVVACATGVASVLVQH